MKTIMTSRQVAELVFPRTQNPDFVPQSTVAAAEQKFIEPVLNGLYAAMVDGRYPELAEEYVRPALALYVKYLMLPTLAAQAGSLGVIQPRGTNFEAADSSALHALRRRTRADALALMRRAVSRVESAPSEYPEYDPGRNVLRRVAMDSNVVLPRR